jgi:CheY-like chemotaxis protein
MQSEKKVFKRKFHVLCIDDNQDFLQVLSHLIDALGYDLTTAISAVEGIDIAHAKQPHIIFCDLGLPNGMDGFEFARLIRADETLKNIPMVAVSARTDDESRAKALASGFDKTLSKPVKFADIRTVLLEMENCAN